MTDRVSRRPLILVVDDERALIPMYAELFESEGWGCVCWRLPEPADAVAELGPDVVLTDLVVADDRDAGRRFVEDLAAHPATVSIPVVVCSADVRQLREASSWMERYACSQIEKPFDIDVLTAEILRCLQERSVSPFAPQPVAR
jgi:DNA-binding NtrC family response regulator